MSAEHSDDVTRTHIAIAAGTTIQHYRIIEKIGAGGMGEVYLAEDTRLNRRVALKFLPIHQAQDAELRIRFTREAQAAAKLDHPNIVTIHEVSEFGGNPFFAMQYIQGKSLHWYCHDEQLPISKIIPLVAQVADGLAKAHSLGVVHRDIKSSNIVVDSDFRPKILDFGLATIQGGDILTKAGSTLGTVAYMSPEQVQGREADHRADIFSLGVVLYELLAGRTPFKRNSDGASLHAIINESPEPLSRYKADISPDLQRIVNKCLSKNPAERYQSAAELASDLRTLIRTGDSGEVRTSSRVAITRPSIAVLPFANMSADPENEFFSDGLTEELLNVLAKNPELKVTGRTSSFAFKGKQEDLRNIGQKLGVETILEGSVRKAGNRVRITAQLVSVVDGFHLWSETFDRVLDDIFAVQDDIAKAVSKSLHVTLVGIPEERKVVNPESYALVLRGHQSVQQMTKESLSLAIEMFEKAVSIDPANAQAWAGLADALGNTVAYGHGDHSALYPRARYAAEKAIELDQDLPEGHAALGFVLGALELKLVEAGSRFRKAYELAPNHAQIVQSIGLWEMILGNFDESLRFLRKAVELDPLDPWARRELSRSLSMSGRYDEAREAMNRVLEMSPNMTTAYLGLCFIALAQGKFEEALAVIEKESTPGYRFCGKAMALFGLGRQAESDAVLSDLIAQGEQWGHQIATVYAFRGETDRAFEWLERAFEIHDAGIPLTKVAPFFRSLHSDPRWPTFLKKIGLGE